MKKLIIITAGIALTGITLYGMYRVLALASGKELNPQVEISLKDFDYTVEFVQDYDEEWYSFKHSAKILIFRELTHDNMTYLKCCNPLPLPISETEYRQMIPYKIPKPFMVPDTGYYIYRNGIIPDFRRKDSGGHIMVYESDFKVFIIDTEKKLGILYD